MLLIFTILNISLYSYFIDYSNKNDNVPKDKRTLFLSSIVSNMIFSAIICVLILAIYLNIIPSDNLFNFTYSVVNDNTLPQLFVFLYTMNILTIGKEWYDSEDEFLKVSILKKKSIKSFLGLNITVCVYGIILLVYNLMKKN